MTYHRNKIEAPSRKVRDAPVVSTEIRCVLNNIMRDLGSIAQDVVNSVEFPSEETKALVYVRTVTSLVERVAKMMIKLNKRGVEKIMRMYSIEGGSKQNYIT